MTARCLVLAGILLSFLAPAASGATLAVNGGTLEYAAEAGEENGVVFEQRAATTIHVYDLSESVQVPGAGCIPAPEVFPSVPPQAYVDYECTGVSETIEAVFGDEADFALSFTDLTTTLQGDDGNDLLVSEGAGGAVIQGGGGNDELYSGQGGDQLDGGDGVDLLRGAEGDDTLSGGAGNDALAGEYFPEDEGPLGEETGDPGDDSLDGGDGDDQLIGGGGDDRYAGGSGYDVARLLGGGKDALSGDLERIEGSEKPDDLVGSEEANHFLGLEANDRLTGNGGDDTLDGGEGADTLDGGPGSDSFDGGRGDDTLLARDGVSDRVSCGEGIDRVTADDNDVIETACEFVDRPTNPVGASGAMSLTAKVRKKNKRQLVTVTGRVVGVPCQGQVAVSVTGLRPRKYVVAAVRPDCSFVTTVRGAARRAAKLTVTATHGALAAPAVVVRAR